MLKGRYHRRQVLTYERVLTQPPQGHRLSGVDSAQGAVGVTLVDVHITLEGCFQVNIILSFSTVGIPIHPGQEFLLSPVVGTSVNTLLNLV